MVITKEKDICTGFDKFKSMIDSIEKKMWTFIFDSKNREFE